MRGHCIFRLHGKFSPFLSSTLKQCMILYFHTVRYLCVCVWRGQKEHISLSLELSFSSLCYSIIIIAVEIRAVWASIIEADESTKISVTQIWM